MLIKIYELIKKIIKENLFLFTMLTILLILSFIKLPYVIISGGGIQKLDGRIEIENAYKNDGGFYAAYVSEMECNPITYLFAKIFNYDINKVENIIYPNETLEDDYKRNSILFDTSLSNAILVAYKNNNEYIKITSSDRYIIYVDENANTDLKIGDKILEINNIDLNIENDISSILKDNKINDRINLKVENNNKIYDRYAYIYEINNNLVIGVSINTNYNFETNRNYEIKSYKGLGPSGGLMTSLYVYNQLNEFDYTKGLKIAGTGTIDINGNVGEIGGISYKIIGAAKQKADIFFCPEGNYEEALNTINNEKLSIKLVKVKNFEEALNYLENL